MTARDGARCNTLPPLSFRRVIGVIAAVAALAAVAAAPVSAAPRVDAGGRIVQAEVCGKKAPLHLMLPGPREFTVTGAEQAVVRLERCTGGKWKPFALATARRRSAGHSRARPTLPAGVDLRVRAVVGGVASAPLYVESVEPGTTGAIVDLPVSFDVQNVNRSALTCSSDGKDYRLNGHLVAPAATFLTGQRSVTLYLHEFGFGEWFWHFPTRSYDYATQQALAGHASVVVDRLGYDSSPGPNGSNICLGSQADMAHQAVLQLRGASYKLVGGPVRAFRKVALAGHSIGASVGQILAYSFGDIDAFVDFGYADQGYSNGVTTSAVAQGGRCAQGGEPAEPGRESGYAYFASAEESPGLLFHDADPAVIEQAKALRNRDPCGDANSNVPAIVSNTQHVSEIKVPILLVFGANDAGFSDPHDAGNKQRAAYSGSSDVTLKFVEDTGHAITLERSAPTTRSIVHDWLKSHGF
jgi:pimeloyl-ACP methyl ester carboxylesterase